MKVALEPMVECGAQDQIVDGLGSVEIVDDTVRLKFYTRHGEEKRHILTVRCSRVAAAEMERAWDLAMETLSLPQRN